MRSIFLTLSISLLRNIQSLASCIFCRRSSVPFVHSTNIYWTLGGPALPLGRVRNTKRSLTGEEKKAQIVKITKNRKGLEKNIRAKLNLEKDNTCSLPGIRSTQMYLLIPALCLPCASHSGEYDKSKTEPSLLINLELIFSNFMIPFFSRPS